MKSKEMQKLVADTQDCAERLANYSQPFVIGALPIFDERGTLHDPVGSHIT
jgi:hypothetical protein